jgi:protein MAK16
MDKQIWDDQPAPFSQASEEDEEQDGLGENEEDGRDDSEQAEEEDDVGEERDNSDSDMDARVIKSEETSSEISSDQYDSEKEDDNDV